MAELSYITPTSLDGYIADETGNQDWSTPDEEAFAFLTPGRTPAMLDFARLWQAADKIVDSKLRETVTAPKTRLEREFRPQVVSELEAQSPLDILGGRPDPCRLRDPQWARRRVSSARLSYCALAEGRGSCLVTYTKDWISWTSAVLPKGWFIFGIMLMTVTELGSGWRAQIFRNNKSMNNTRVFKMAFAGVYPHYIAKAEKKGRTKEEVHAIIHWLTGYDEQALQQQIDKRVDFETFFARAPRINPNVSKITGVICGYRVEEMEDKLMQQIRYLDKLVDELAKGKAMDKILRK